MMQTITFQCETITPMFLAGADGVTPELRAPSIKGALRFWWRAMNGNKYSDISALKAAESAIFGGVEPTASRSKVIILCPPNLNKLKIYYKNSEKQLPKHEKNYPLSRGSQIDILKYLAFGAYNHIDHYKHGYFEVNQTFGVQIKLLDESKRQEIIDAFVLLCYVGGLGSKTRNGFGKLNIMSAVDENKNDIKLNDWKTLIKSNNSTIINFSTLSSKVELYKLQNVAFTTYDKALAAIGDAYISTRKNVKDGHTYNVRRYIAAPILQDREAFLDRHSKPYFLTILKESNLFVGYILFLPYNYCQDIDNENIKKGKRLPLNVKTNFDNNTLIFNKELNTKIPKQP